MNMEISTFLMLLPSSARIFIAVSSVMTYSLPSPAIWLYTPSSSALSSVDLPWYPPPTMSVIPFFIPMPCIFPACGSAKLTFMDSGAVNFTASFIGLPDTPDSRGRMDASATNATSPCSFK